MRSGWQDAAAPTIAAQAFRGAVVGWKGGAPWEMIRPECGGGYSASIRLLGLMHLPLGPRGELPPARNTKAGQEHRLDGPLRKRSTIGDCVLERYGSCLVYHAIPLALRVIGERWRCFLFPCFFACLDVPLVQGLAMKHHRGCPLPFPRGLVKGKRIASRSCKYHTDGDVPSVGQLHFRHMPPVRCQTFVKA